MLKVVSDKKSIKNRADHIPDSSKKVLTPIYRAKKIDSDELVEGYLMPFANTKGWFIRILNYTDLMNAEFEIDPSTLEISFDNGDTWYDDFQLIDETLERHMYKGI